MSRELTMDVVVEELQGVIAHLMDIHAAQGRAFTGAAVQGVPVTYRDDPIVTMWRVGIFPADRPDPTEPVEAAPAEEPIA